MLRFDPGRPAGHRAFRWCAGRTFDPEAMSAPRAALVDRGPDHRPAVAGRCWTASAAAPGRHRTRASRRRSRSSTTGRAAAALRAGLRRAWPVEVLRTGGRGPAAARNVGWRAADRLDRVSRRRCPGRAATGAPTLAADLLASRRRVGRQPGQSVVPLPTHRRPTDWERGTAGLETRALDHRRHGLPASGAGIASAASTSGSRGPSARTPTSPSGCWTAGYGLTPGRGDHHASGAAAPAGG